MRLKSDFNGLIKISALMLCFSFAFIKILPVWGSDILRMLHYLTSWGGLKGAEGTNCLKYVVSLTSLKNPSVIPMKNVSSSSSCSSLLLIEARLVNRGLENVMPDFSRRLKWWLFNRTCQQFPGGEVSPWFDWIPLSLLHLCLHQFRAYHALCNNVFSATLSTCQARPSHQRDFHLFRLVALLMRSAGMLFGWRRSGSHLQHAKQIS